MAETASDLQEAVGDWLDGPIVRIGAEDTPWPYNRGLEQDSMPHPDDVLAAAEKAFGI